MKRIIKYVLILLVVGICILFVGLKKHIQMETMETYETEHFIVYYEVLEQATLRDISDTLEANYPLINHFF